MSLLFWIQIENDKQFFLRETPDNIIPLNE